MFVTPITQRFSRVRLALRRSLGRRSRHLHRLSRKSLQFLLLLCGAALVSFVSMGFAHMADYALELNHAWMSERPWLAFILLPFGLAAVCWLTLRLSPFSAGSGIPQVIASISMPWGPAPMRLVSLVHVVWKIPLTFLGMLAGASIGREGPSVQVGAGLMLAWGMLCRRIGVPLKGVHPSELIATGAAGGLAAAFNAPLAGMIFAIEELGRGTALRWQRVVLLGVLASGFFTLAVVGSNPYFGEFNGRALEHDMLLWTLTCALACGVAGGVFGRLLGKGAAVFAPSRWRGWLRRHPVAVAFLMGLLVAFLGLLTAGGVYGTGYNAAAQALAGTQPDAAGFSLAKIGATLASYWAGIPGGIFTPALTIGASIGAELSLLADAAIDGRVLVLISMAAFLASATQSPITSSVIVMEMTGSQPMLFWLLLGALAASMVGKQFCPQPFYHMAAGRFRQRVTDSGHSADT